MNITLGPEVFNRAAIKIRVTFKDRIFKADQKVGISVYLNYNVPQGSGGFLPITSLILGLQWINKDKSKSNLKVNRGFLALLANYFRQLRQSQIILWGYLPVKNLLKFKKSCFFFKNRKV